VPALSLTSVHDALQAKEHVVRNEEDEAQTAEEDDRRERTIVDDLTRHAPPASLHAATVFPMQVFPVNVRHASLLLGM
jgi:hypothetical protein